MRGRESERRIEGNETLDNGWVHIAEVAVGAVVLLILLMLFLPFQS
jgi:hypothetical protein